MTHQTEAIVREVASKLSRWWLGSCESFWHHHRLLPVASLPLEMKRLRTKIITDEGIEPICSSSHPTCPGAS